MDPKPIAIVIEELERLLREMKAARQPTNGDLAQAVWSACRRTRPDMNPKPTPEAIHGF